MTRTINSVTTRTVSTATHLGWELNFVHEATSETESVHCNGSNGTGGSINASRNGSNSGVNFSGWDYDSVLSNDIVAEMELIINPVV